MTDENKRGDRPHEQDQGGEDVTAPASAPPSRARGPEPTVQLGSRISWSLDQQFRAYVDDVDGTHRAHQEQAFAEWVEHCDSDPHGAAAEIEAAPVPKRGEPTAPLGGRISWELDQRLRATVEHVGGTIRAHQETAIRRYLSRRAEQ